MCITHFKWDEGRRKWYKQTKFFHNQGSILPKFDNFKMELQAYYVQWWQLPGGLKPEMIC